MTIYNNLFYEPIKILDYLRGGGEQMTDRVRK